MTFQYEAEFRFNLANLVPEVGRLIDSLNDATASCGYDEKLVATTGPLVLVVQSDKELTEEQQYQMKRLLESEMIQQFPKYGVRLTQFGRKSVTSESSAV